MNTLPLFEQCQLTLPDNIEVEAEGEGEALQYFLGDKNEQGGVLSVRRMQWIVPEADKREKMLASVFAESDMEQLADDIYWGLEELTGEDDGEDVAITRWLVACLTQAETFTLLIFNYTVAGASEHQQQINEEVLLFEEAIQKAVWL